MKMLNARWIYFSLIAVCLLTGCTKAKAPPLNVQVPDQLILYSIDPGVMGPGRPPVTEGDELFHGYSVLGKIDVASAEDRRMLMTEYEAGKSKQPPKACFNPRHGIRTIHQDKTTDYLICFECNQSYIYTGDAKSGSDIITESAQGTFNKHLTDAGIPLAQPPAQ